MKNNKGISMITLIVTIICMIIFLGLTYSIGSRYISSSKQKEREALVSVISDAAERRQNDNYVTKEEKLFYVGYHISSGDFEKLYSSFENKENIYDPGAWYALDASKAKKLGIIDAEEYLVDNLKEVSGEDENKYIAVVDYFTGNVELIKYEDVDSIVVDNIEAATCDHEATILSCTEPAICKKCGEIIARVSHSFNKGAATCTESKVCVRCGYIEEKALGHDYSAEISYNDEGHFNRCTRCNAIGNFEVHQKVYTADEETWTHNIECTKCDYIVNEACRKEYIPKDTVEHTVRCIDCLKRKDVDHDSTKYRYVDKRLHMIYCETCNSDLYLEEHTDIQTPYGVCDECNGVLDLTIAPEILELTMENNTVAAPNIYFAKYGEKIKITIETTVVLGEAPTIKLKGIKINSNNIKQDDANPLMWIATIDTTKYNFSDGEMDISLTDIRSVWGVKGEDVSVTTDGKYITYDATKPKYIYLP